MGARFENVVKGLRSVGDDAMSSFGSLSADQLNWKPAPKSWSVAQCFDHLITTHSLYLPKFEQLATRNVEMSFWEKASPFSGFFGRFLIKGLDPTNLKPMKTTAKAFPSESEIGGDIIKRFVLHQARMMDAIIKLPSDVDPTKQIITSPLLGIVTYSLDDCFTVLVIHCQRHFNQAKRVTESERFPK